VHNGRSCTPSGDDRAAAHVEAFVGGAANPVSDEDVRFPQGVSWNFFGNAAVVPDDFPEDIAMAVNKPVGDNARKGAVPSALSSRPRSWARNVGARGSSRAFGGSGDLGPARTAGP
jgi:hypothetical protein